MKIKMLLITLLIVFGVSCSNGKIKEEKSLKVTEIYDPLEPLNRRIYYFNAKVDKYFLIPIVDGYKLVTPDPLEKGVTNFFGNIGEVKNFVNNTLQGNVKGSLVTLNRFSINSTFGILGLFDVATKVGLKKENTDFGLTLARYGVNSGAYIVLPILGPSTLRDTFGKGIDTLLISRNLDPLNIIGMSQQDIEIFILSGIDTRAATDFRYYSTDSPFEYELIRYIYVILKNAQGDILKEEAKDSKKID